MDRNGIFRAHNIETFIAMEVTVKPGQTLPDIAVQVYGDLRAVMLLAKENDISVTLPIAPGTVLRCPEMVYDKYRQDYVRNNGVSPATAPERYGDIRISIFTEHFTEEFR